MLRCRLWRRCARGACAALQGCPERAAWGRGVPWWSWVDGLAVRRELTHDSLVHGVTSTVLRRT